MKAAFDNTGFDRPRRAFTLVEMMITSAVFLLLFTAIIYTYIFALNLHETDRIKLTASDEARKTLNQLVDEIRSANKVRIGNRTGTNFVPCGTNGFQLGNAIQIYPTNTSNVWLQYYYETNTVPTNYFSRLMFVSYSNSAQPVQAIASSVTNTLPVFTAEDSYGNVITNNLNVNVIGVCLQFRQLQYPLVNIGPTNYFQYYQLHTRITRRMMY